MITDSPDPLCRRALALCDAELTELGPGAARDGVAGIRRGLSEPLRVAVGGRVSAGKSTLVNALLGRRLAPTGATETTRYVTWLRHGAEARAELCLHDGSRSALPLTRSGGLPDTLGADPATVAAIDVWLPSEVLRSVTLVDTPGLASANAGLARAAQAALGIAAERSAVARADALVYVVAGDVRADDAAALDAFRARFAGASALNVIAVVTKADRARVAQDAGSADAGWSDPLAAAAGRIGGALHALPLPPVPVIGLLAETAATGALGRADVRALRDLLALEPAARAALLASVDEFLEGDAPVSQAARRRLLARLGRHGVGAALVALGAPGTSAPKLHRSLGALSGIGALEAQLHALAARADALKADRGLGLLTELTYRRPDLLRLRDAVERLRLEPAMHELELVRAFQRCATVQVALPPALVGDVERLVARTPPADAGERFAAWKRFEHGGAAGAPARRLAAAVTRSYETLMRSAA